MSFSSSIIHRFEQRSLSGKRFAIVTNNCWGSDIYNTLGREYNTPFVGLYLRGDGYINLLSDFCRGVNARLRFLGGSNLSGETFDFPVAVLGDGIEIYFMHYRSQEEAQQKWARRLTRLNRALDDGAELRFKFCDQAGSDERFMRMYHQLDIGSKISFGVRPFESSRHVCVSPDPGSHMVPNGPRLYRKRYQYFDFCEWIGSGKVAKTARSRMLSMLR